jgi:hypothetical protein
MQIDPSKLINFNSYEWQVIEKWLEEQKKAKIGLLIADSTHDKTNQVRGALQMINQILALKSAAQNTPQ